MDDVKSKIVELDLNDILPNRFQPRIKFNEESIIELSESIKVHGVIQPIIVRAIGDKYEIVTGERRYKASVLAGVETIPARIFDLNDKDSAEVALIENVQREGLTPIEEAISYKKILDMGYITQEQLARKLGRSQSTIANKKRLLNLCDEVQEALMDEKISERHARSLLKLSNPTDQQNMLKRIISERLTVRKLDEEISKFLSGDTSISSPKEDIIDKAIEDNKDVENSNNNDEKDNSKTKEEDSIIDISSLFDDDVISSNTTFEDIDIRKKDDSPVKETEVKNKEEKKEVADTMFIESNENKSNFDFNTFNEKSSSFGIFNTSSNKFQNGEQKMSMSDIMQTESSKRNNSFGITSNNNSFGITSNNNMSGQQNSMFNNLMNQNNSSSDNYIDAETFNNYLDPAYIDGQKQFEPQNKNVIDSSVFSKFLDPEYDLSHNNNPIKDQFTTNQPAVSSMSFAEYLSSDTKADEIPVSQTKVEPVTTNMEVNNSVPSIFNSIPASSVPEIKVTELPTVVPSDLIKEEPVVEEPQEEVKEPEKPVMVMATDLTSLTIPNSEISTSELLTSAPLEMDNSIIKNVPGTPFAFDANGIVTVDNQTPDVQETSSPVIDGFKFDANGNVIADNQAPVVSGPQQVSTGYQFDTNGNVIADNQAPVVSEPQQVSTGYQFDANGNVVADNQAPVVSGPQQASTGYQFDANGNVVADNQAPVANEPQQASTGYQFDANGNVIADNQASVLYEPSQPSVTNDNLTPTLNESTSSTIYTYDEQGNVIMNNTEQTNSVDTTQNNSMEGTTNMQGIDQKPDLLAPIGSPVNMVGGNYDPNKTIEQVNREREAAERALYERATAPLTPDFSLSQEKTEESQVAPVQPQQSTTPIFVTATETNVASPVTAPIIDNPDMSNLLKQEEVVPVVEPEPVVEEVREPEPTIINPSIDTLENKPIIVTDYNKQYDPVLPTSAVATAPSIGLKEVINMIRKLGDQIEGLGFSIDLEEFDLEDQYQVIFKIDKK